MDGLAFITALVGAFPMPMAEHFEFELVGAAKGEVRARATPAAHHENPWRGARRLRGNRVGYGARTRLDFGA